MYVHLHRTGIKIKLAAFRRYYIKYPYELQPLICVHLVIIITSLSAVITCMQSLFQFSFTRVFDKFLICNFLSVNKKNKPFQRYRIIGIIHFFMISAHYHNIHAEVKSKSSHPDLGSLHYITLYSPHAATLFKYKISDYFQLSK